MPVSVTVPGDLHPERAPKVANAMIPNFTGRNSFILRTSVFVLARSHRKGLTSLQAMPYMAREMASRPALRVLIAAPRGFCAGVDRAIQIVESQLTAEDAA